MSYLYQSQVAFYPDAGFLFVNRPEGVMLYLNAKHGKTYRVNSRFDTIKVYNKTPVKQIVVYSHYLIILLDTYELVAVDIHDIQAGHKTWPLLKICDTADEKGNYIHDIMFHAQKNLLCIFYYNGGIRYTDWPVEQNNPRFEDVHTEFIPIKVSTDQRDLMLYGIDSVMFGTGQLAGQVALWLPCKFIFITDRHVYYVSRGGSLLSTSDVCNTTVIDYKMAVRQVISNSTCMVVLTPKDTLHLIKPNGVMEEIGSKIKNIYRANDSHILVDYGKEITLQNVGNLMGLSKRPLQCQ